MTTTPVRPDPQATQVVGTYPDYPAAERALALLADRGFPVETVRILGRDVQLRIQVPGRATPWRAVGTGAVTGMWMGGLLGLVLTVATPMFVTPLLWGLVLGALLGALSGGLAHLVRRRGGHLATVRDLAADHYDLVVPADLRYRASSILTEEHLP